MDPRRVGALYRQHPLAAWAANWAAFVSLVGVLVGVGLLVAREATLGFLWTDVVGPWLAENRGEPVLAWNGHTATPGYTPALEAFYVLLIVFALANAWYALVRGIELPFDRELVYAITPAALGATLARVLEDALFFCREGTLAAPGCQTGPATYVATSPGSFTLVYFLICPMIGVLAWRMASPRENQRVQMRWLLAVQALVALVVLVAGRGWFAFTLPWTVAAFLAADPAYAWLREADWGHVTAGVGASGLAWLTIAGAHLAARTPAPSTLGPSGLAYAAWVLAATVAALVGVWGLARGLAGRVPRAGGLVDRWGLAIVGGHALDGFATFFSVCATPGGLCSGAAFAGLELGLYTEKHPLSEALLAIGDGWAFPLVKLTVAAGLVALAAPYLGEAEEESKVGFLLLVVWYAGLLPGVRDLARVVVGV